MLEALRRGERRAQENFLRRYAPRVFSIAWRMLSNQLDAEELTQDVMVQALQSIDTYDPARASLATWLDRIAYSRALNVIDKQRRRPRPLDIDTDSMSHTLCGQPPDLSGEPPPELIDLLERAIPTLSPADQTLLHLFYFDRQPLADIAYITGMTTGTIATRLHRIRQRLRDIINKLRNQ